MDHRPHIVVVEDEAAQRQLLVDYLGKQNFRVSGADGGTALRKLLERELPSLVLLDIGLPGEDGFVLARWLRERSGRIGIIMVTAAADTVDRVVGLETGADDYIAKPFEPRELLARVKSVLRRTTGATASTGPRVRMGRRVLDLEKRVLIDPASGDEETLAASELDLLKVFAENPNRPLNRDWLLEVTAHREMEAFDRAIDLRITRLRRKIEADPSHPDAIRTVRGVGYMFVPPTEPHCFVTLAGGISASARRSSAASGPRPSRQRVRSPALPACSSADAAAPTPAAPTVCAAPLSLCAAAAREGRSPARDAAAISRSAAIAVSRNLASSELIAAASSPSQAASTSRSIAEGGFGASSVWVVSRVTSSIGIQRSSVVRSWSMFTGLAR